MRTPEVMIMIRNNLTGAQVQKMADNEKVLVNVNRLYARLVKTGNDCKAAYNALKKVPNERAMFVELTVKDVLQKPCLTCHIIHLEKRRLKNDSERNDWL